MWLEIELNAFKVRYDGFIVRTSAENTLYLSPGLSDLVSIAALAEAERGIAIDINTRERHIVFGRDYLGQYPLLYVLSDSQLFLSDDILLIDEWSKKNNVERKLSEEAMALYFSLGYVPQGMTVFDEVKSCKNVTLYHYKNHKITEENIFTPIAEKADHHVNDVADAINEEVKKISKNQKQFDVWCSGGIDSSVMAHCFSRDGVTADILTLGYDEETTAEFGDGEIQYASEMASYCQSPLRYAQLSSNDFLHLHHQFTRAHIGPVIDTCVIAKYALAQATKNSAITGEGGDPIFGGVKNTSVLFTHAQHPRLPLGWVYARAHFRFFDRLEDIFVHGKDLSDYVVEYLGKKLDFYPGELLRKLFYLNTIEKQGGMIFPQTYYPEKRSNISVHHPLTNLAVYKSAFQLNDNRRYVYPDGKLVLSQLFKNRIPRNIIERKKSGTIIPLDTFLKNMPSDYRDISELGSSQYFNSDFLSQTNISEEESSLLMYGFISLNRWLHNRKGESDGRSISMSSCDMQ